MEMRIAEREDCICSLEFFEKFSGQQSKAEAFKRLPLGSNSSSSTAYVEQISRIEAQQRNRN